MNASTLFVLVLAIVLNAVANILIKASALNKSDPGVEGLNLERLIKGVLLNPWLIGGVTSFALALVAYRLVLAHMKLSVAYPIMTTCGFAIVILASRLFFHEELNAVQWAGIGVLVIGIWMIASQMGGA